MLYTKVLDEYKIDYEEYLREREVDFFGMKDRYLKYIQTKGIDHFTFIRGKKRCVSKFGRSENI